MRGHLFLNQNEYLTVEEFHLIRNMDLPQDFLDFLEIGFRTGLRSKDILSLKRENIDLQKERIIGTPQKTNLPMDVALDKTSLSIKAKQSTTSTGITTPHGRG
jgi:integrase